MQARERLFITADKKRLVSEGDPKGAFLYAAPGDEIPESAVAMFGLVDGALPEEKRGDKGEDKRGKGGEDKGGKPGDKKDLADLTEIKGIGPKVSAALASKGIDSFEKLRAVDSSNPPDIGIAVKPADWLSWKTQAEALGKAAAEKVPPAEPVGGLTVTTLNPEV